MRRVIYILLYYLTWQRMMRWITGFGLVLVLLSIPIFLASEIFAIQGLLLGYLLSLAFPFTLTPMVFRELIANHHLALVPGFHLRAGIALLILTGLLSISFPFFLAINPARVVNPWSVLVVFTVASFYVGIYQLILPSRFAIPLTIISFVLPFLLLFQYKALIHAVFLDPRFLVTVSVISVLGWMYGLVVLSRTNYFLPPYQSSLTADSAEWFTADVSAELNWVNWIVDGHPGTAAGTLLVGYPDGLANRIKWALSITVISPLLCSLFLVLLYVLGLKDLGEQNILARLFLMLSLLLSIAVCLDYSELAARCRLIWLRRGGDRMSLWQFMERYIITTLGMYILIAGVIGMTFLLLTDVPQMHLLYYLTMVTCGGLLCSYLSLACKTHNWSSVATGIANIIALGFLLVSSMIVLLGKEYYQGILVSNPVVFASIPSTLVILALLLRWFARRGFTAIDWYLVKIRPVHRPRRPRDGITVTG